MLAKDVSADQPLLTNKRHKRSIKKALNSLNNAFVAFELEEPNELVLSDLGVCLSHLDSILGITAPDEILDSVFNEFCVGK
jgi:tRNA modification GTPase